MGTKRQRTAEMPLVAGMPEKWVQAYALLHSAVSAHEEVVNFPYPMSQDTFQGILNAVVGEHVFYSAMDPRVEIYFNSRGNVTATGLTYFEDKEHVERFNQRADEIADDLVACAASLPDDYAKLVAFADYLLSTVDETPFPLPYDISEHDDLLAKLAFAQSVPGTLIGRKAVCLGFARTLAMLCNRSGIECFVVFGKHVSEPRPNCYHAWNMVVLDGEPYYVDLMASQLLMEHLPDGGLRFPLLFFHEDLEARGYRMWLRPFAKTGDSERAKANRWVSCRRQHGKTPPAGKPALKAS